MIVRELNLRLQDLYFGVVPKCVQSRLTPWLIKAYASVIRVPLKRRKKSLSHIGVRITGHCNLNCKSCHQFSPLAEPEYVDTATFTDDFQRLHALTKGDIKEILLKGGEPLLHPQLPELMRTVRGIFDKSRIILVTNGILLSKQNDDFWNVCAGENIEIQISHYPIKIDYAALLNTSKKHGVKLRYLTKRPQVMLKLVFDLDGRQNAKKNFYKCCQGNDSIHVDGGKLYNCCLVPCIKHFNKFFGKNMQVSPEDSIDIHGDTSLGAILKFSSEPIPFCRYCAVDKAVYGEQWGHSKKDVGEWT